MNLGPYTAISCGIVHEIITSGSISLLLSPALNDCINQHESFDPIDIFNHDKIQAPNPTYLKTDLQNKYLQKS